VGERHGWLPHHIVVHDSDNRLCGIAPLYLKNNSYGEFVFDWAWADAWHRAGVPYYPKLVSSIPYTPVTGNRLLVAADADRESVTRHLIERALQLVDETGSSTLHWLFTSAVDTGHLLVFDHLRRTGCHFHWHNAGYRSFDEFLAALSSRKRKKIRRERRRVAEAGSFSAVARETAMSQSTVSKHIAALEQRLGTKLLNRSTRQLNLTEAGKEYYHYCVRILNDFQEAEASVGKGRILPTGTLRLSSTAAFGRKWIMPMLADFLAKYPDISIDYLTEDRYIDLVKEGVDLAIRVGPLADSALIARKIGSSDRPINGSILLPSTCSGYLSPAASRQVAMMSMRCEGSDLNSPLLLIPSGQ